MASLSWEFPYASRRMPVFAENLVATSQPLAAQAGLRMLLKGGNAVDAALATAIALTVVEPVSNGIGSDAFAIIWGGSTLFGINGSGRSPESWTFDRFSNLDRMPQTGWDAVTVPGAVALWTALSKRFGVLPFEDLFAPAIRYAEHGFPVSPIVANAWASARETYGHMPEFLRTFLPKGSPPRPGERFSCSEMARTLKEIATTRGESFYRGRLAHKIAACSHAGGGALTEADLAHHRSEWVRPIHKDYGDVRLHEIPPNGQGLAALIALGILDHLDLSRFSVDSADSVHLQVEAMKIAFDLTHRYVGDPEYMDATCDDLLDDAFLAEKAREIRLDRALPPAAAPREPGTVYIAAADARGMMVSLIQSNYTGFGSGVVIPGTGISLQSRAHGFVVKKGHPNCVGGGKRPFHTIIPGFVTRNDQPIMAFGVMGAHMQPQGHMQMVVRIFTYGQNPQAASDAPRWHVCEDGALALEPGFDSQIAENLRNRGHRLANDAPTAGYGGAQLIMRTDHGYCAASDHRKDGQAVGY